MAIFAVVFLQMNTIRESLNEKRIGIQADRKDLPGLGDQVWGAEHGKYKIRGNS
jgi:hypothetical protein